MDLKRAKQIMESRDTIRVLYERKPVWIESLNEIDNTAQISFTGSSGEEIVSVNKLVEG